MSRYAEIKVKKRIGPSEAKKIVEKGTIDFVIAESEMSKKTIKIFEDADIQAYQIPEDKVKEKLKEIEKEKEKE